MTRRFFSTVDPMKDRNIDGKKPEEPTCYTTSVSSIPGDDIKIVEECTFSMDFDTLTSISFITTGPNVLVEGILGWKGIDNC